MKFNDTLSGAALLALALAILFTIQSYPTIPGQNIGPAAFPGLLASLLAVCSVLLIIKGLRNKEHKAWIELGDWMQSRFHARNFVITIACLVYYIVLSDKLGFLICASTILMAMFWALEVKKTWIVPIAVLVTLVIHTVFYKGLRVPLPWGVLMPLQW
jgi:putative tricarboxylic transport membrane protein